MNKRDRVLRAMNGEAVDRPPVFSASSTATFELEQKLGLKWPAFHQKAEAMAHMGLAALELFDFDAVRVPFCQTIEAEALGCEVSYRDFTPGNDIPLYKLDDTPQFPDDFLGRGRIPELLAAMRWLKKEVDGRAFVFGGVVGPLGIARALLDSVPLLKASLRSPGKITPFIDVGKRASVELALALLEAGAEAIVMEDMTASPDLLHPKTYKATVAKAHREVIESIPAPVVLHVCGNVALIAEEMAGAGARALSIDPKAGISQMREKVGRQVLLVGGVDTIALSLSTPERIKELGLKALEEGIDILAPGCAIPPNSPTENLKVMVEAANAFGRG